MARVKRAWAMDWEEREEGSTVAVDEIPSAIV